MKDPAVSVSDFTLSFGSRTLVSSASFQVFRGETVALVGESGTGKSSILHALLGGGFAKPATWSGEVEFKDRFIGAVAPDVVDTRLLAFVPQDPYSWFHPLRRVGAQLLETVRVHGMGRADARLRVRELLDAVELFDGDRLLRSFPHQLSGGMLARCALAGALAHDPAVLLADEPTSSLDDESAAVVIDLLRACSTRGMGVLIATHDARVVEDLADRVLTLANGDITPYTPSEIHGEVKAANVGSPRSVCRVRNISVTVDERRHASVPDFDVVSGEVVAVVGPSGSGKTSLCRALCGLSSAATLSFDPVMPLRGVTDVQMVYQNARASLDERLSVRRALSMFASRAASNDREFAVYMSNVLRVAAVPERLLDRRIGTLSGGEAQRVALARALGVHPRVLVLDEPFSGLDADLRDGILQKLTTWAREHSIAVVLVTHDREMATRVALSTVEVKLLAQSAHGSTVAR